MMNNWNKLPAISGYPARMMGGRHLFGGIAGYASPGSNGLFVITAILHIATWILIMALLVAVIRYIWKKGGK